MNSEFLRKVGLRYDKPSIQKIANDMYSNVNKNTRKLSDLYISKFILRL